MLTTPQFFAIITNSFGEDRKKMEVRIVKHLEFYQKVQDQMKQQFFEEEKTIEQASVYCADTIMKKRLIHVYGCGHSQMFAMEVFYRAGGLVPVNALLMPHVALFPKAKLSTFEERIEGYSQELLELVDTSEDDTMIIVSVSGRNASVIDMALAAHEKGMKVVVLTSKRFSGSVASRHSSGKKLGDIADVVIDIKCEAGDACLSMPELKTKFTGTSTLLGMLVMDCIMSRTIERCVEQGYQPPVYISSNLDGGDEINREFIQAYCDKIECL